MGHKDTSTTERHYVKIMDEAMDGFLNLRNEKAHSKKVVG
jgi:hypothetical protein